MTKEIATLDPSFCRAQFSALKRDFIFMDNAGGSQVPDTVIHRVTDYYRTSNVQLGASYSVSRLAQDRVSETVKRLSTFVGASDPAEIVIGSSATSLLRILSLCIARTWKTGDEVIITNSEHEANASCWTDLVPRGIRVKIWNVDPHSFSLSLETLRNLLSEKTRLVSVAHASNLLGTINPVRQIADVVHSAGALICVDGVAYAPHRKVDVRELDADFYVLSCYKVFGPHIGLLYGKGELLLAIPGINHNFIGHDEIPYKFQPGNLNFELTYGMGGSLDYLEAVARHHHCPSQSSSEVFDFAFDLIAQQEELLSTQLIAWLKQRSDLRIIGLATGDRRQRVSTISFVSEKKSSKEIVSAVDPFNIGIRFGDFYAKKLVTGLELEKHDGVVRVSMLHYNTTEEVKALVSALEEVLAS